MANSTSDAVGAAAAAAVTAIGITSGSPPVTVPVVRRKSPSVPEGASPGLPQFVVSVGEETDSERITGAHRMKKIRFAVTIVTNTGQQQADDATVRQWRDQIDSAIYDKQVTAFGGITNSGANTSFIQIRAFGGPVFDPAALSKDYNYSTLAYEAQVVVPTNL